MGAASNTIVIFKSDNGADNNGRNAPLRARKGTVWEGGIRVPCMMRWPGIAPQGREISQVAITMDLTATLLKAAGVDTGRTKLDGVDLMPVITGKRQPFARTLFWRAKRGESVRKAVRHGDWKLVIDNGNTELHNIARDELEQENVLNANEPVARDLRGRLASWEREVMAPRLRPFKTTPG
jgi:N-acetylgalactosamine-6-sulfatase